MELPKLSMFFSSLWQMLSSSDKPATEDEIFEKIHEQVKGFIALVNLFIILYNQRTGEQQILLAFEKGKRLSLENVKEQEQLLRKIGKEKIQRILDTSTPLFLRTKQEVKDFLTEANDYQVPATWLGVPIRERNRVIGTFVIYHPEKENAYTDEHVKILDAISDQAAVALNNVRLAHQFKLLSQLERELTYLRTSKEDEVLEIIYEQVQQFFDPKNFALILYDKYTDQLKIALAYKQGKPVNTKSKTKRKQFLRKIGETKIKEIIETKQHILLETKEKCAVSLSASEIPASWLGVPMRLGRPEANERAIGAFIIYHLTQEYAYTQDDVEIFDAISDQAANALHATRLKRRFEVLAEAERELTTIRSTNETEVLELIYNQAQKLVDARNLSIILYDKLADDLRFVLAYEDGVCIETQKETEQQRLFDQLGKKKIIQIIQSQQPVLLKTEKDIEEQAESIDEKIYSCWLGVPMRLGEKAIGAFITYHPSQEYAYDEDDREILDAFSDQAANAIDNVRLTQRFKLISEVEQQLTSYRWNEDQILRFISEQTQKLREIDTRNLTIILYDRNTEQLSCSLAFHNGSLMDNIQTEEAQEQLLARLGKKKIEDVIHQKEPLLLETREKVIDYTTSPDGDPYASWLGVPMRLRDTVIGVFVTYHESREYAYDADDLQILDAISDQAAIALDNVRLTQRLETLKDVEHELASDIFSDEEEVLHLIHSKAQRFKEIDTRNLVILLQDDTTQQLRIVMAFRQGRPLNVEKEGVQEWLLQFLGQSKIERLIQTRSPIILKNKEEVKAHASSEKETYTSWLGVPMRLKDGAIGAFVTYHLTRENAYDEDDVEILDALSDQAASAITSTRRLKLEQEQRKQAEVLQEVARIVNSTLDPEKVGEEVLKQLQKVLEYDSASLQRIQGEKRIMLAYRGVPTDFFASELLLNVSKDRLIRKIVEEKRPIILSDTRKSELWDQIKPTARVRSWVGVPLIAQNQVIGLLTIDHGEPGHYTQISGEIAEAYANQVATALLNSEKAQALRELHDIAHSLLAIGRTTDPRELLEQVVNRALEVLNADLIDFYEYREERDQCMLPPISAGEKFFPDIVKEKIHQDDTILKLIHTPEPLYIDDSQKDSTFSAPYEIQRPDQPSQRYVFREEIHSTAVIPLRTENEVMGLMFVSYRTSQPFTEDQKGLIELFAHQAAIAIKNARLYYYVNQRRKALIQIAQNLTAEVRLSENEVLESIYQQADQLLGMKNLTIALYNESTDTVRFALGTVNGRRVDVEKELGWEPRQKGQGKTETIIHSKQTLLLNSQKEIKQKGFSPVPGHKDYEGTLPNSWLGVPMIVRGNVLGVIANYDYGKDNQYTDDDVEILQALADQAAIAIDNARVYQELSKEQTLLQAVINNIPDEIYAKDPDSRFILANRAIFRRLGFTAAKELLGKTDFDLFPKKNAQVYYDKEQEIMRTGEAMVDEEGIGTDQHGKERVSLTTKTPFYDEDCNSLGLVGISRNITRRKQAEDRLKESEQRLTGIIDFLPDATFVINREGKVIAWNRAMEEMTGIKSEEMIAKGDYEYSIPFYGRKRPLLIDLILEPNEEFEKDYISIARHDDTLIAENYLPHMKEGGMYAFGKASRLYDSKNEIAGAILTIRNITERKRAEEALKASEQRLMDIINFLPYATFAIDNEGKVTFWNQAIEEMTGIKANDIKGKGNYEYSLPFFGERRPILIDLLDTPDKEVEEAYETLNRQGDAIQGETYVTIKNEKRYVYSKAAKLYDAQGKSIGAIETIVDISARRRAEEESEALSHRQKVLIDLGQMLTSGIQLEENKILQLIHRNATELMDTDNMYIALYNEITDFVSFPLIYKNGEPIKVAKRKAGAGRTEEIIRTKKPIFIATRKESEKWYKQPGRAEYIRDPLASWIGVPILKGNRVLGVIATYHPTKDYIYSKKDLEVLQTMANLAAIALDNARLYAEMERQAEELRIKTIGLEKANRRIAETQDVLTRSLIAADFVHRLNNLAGTIPIWVDMIRDEIAKSTPQIAEISKFLELIAKDTDGLLNAAEQIKDAPREIKIDMPLLLDNILRQVRIQYRQEIEAKKIDIVKEIVPELFSVWENASSLSNAVYSVISNGVEAILDQGQGILTFKAQNWTDSNGQAWVKLDIVDNGKGIAAENLDKVFTPFFTTRGPGRGYGLWRAKTVIEETLKGQITFISEVGKGTTFTILLPKTPQEG